MEFLQATNLFVSIVFLIIGSLMLYYGADGLVKGSVGIALKSGLSPLVIGLTVVAFGTSSPELLVSLVAGSQGNSEIAVGNVVGSNIANIALILGAAAVITPLYFNIKDIKFDFAVMIFISIAMLPLLYRGELSHIEGAFLAFGIIVYVFVKLRLSRKDKTVEVAGEVKDVLNENTKSTFYYLAFTVGGLIVLILGGQIFLNGAVFVATYLGVSNSVIGLTVVAFGTSLPELATSIVAAIKKESDISIGNAIGSNIFNILSVLGLTALIFPINTSEINNIDLAVMIFVSILIVPLVKWGNRLSRTDGVILLLIYAAYTTYLFVK